MGWLSSASLALGAWTPLANNPNGVAGGGSTRPIVSQLRFLGANGSTTFTDDARPTQIWTPAGNAKIVTDGTAAAGVSGSFGSGTDRITTPISSSFRVTGSARIFCAEAYVKQTSLPGGNGAAPFGQWTNTGGTTTNRRSYVLVLVNSSGVLRILAGIIDDLGAVNVSGNSSNSVATSTWCHVAMYKPTASTGLFMSLDGVVTAIFSGRYIGADAGVVTQQVGGCDDTTTPIVGNMQGFRFHQGYSPYGASNFTPPSPPFPAI